MTDNVIDYAAIRARLNAATPGPWAVEKEGWACISSGGDSVLHAYREIGLGEAEGCEYCRDEDAVVSISIEDAELIAHSRTDLEQLLDRVEALEATVGRVREVLDDYDGLASEPIPKLSTHAWMHEVRAALDPQETP